MKTFPSFLLFRLSTTLFLLIPYFIFSQDSSVSFFSKAITLKEVVVRSNLNVAAFIDRVKNDTTFYKAFRNLKVLGFTMLNDIRMKDKKGKEKASLDSRTRQSVKNGCRWMQTMEEQTSGDLYDKNHKWNYYTAEMYAGLFFANDTICGETNIVKGDEFNTRGKTGLEKHKEQLKMLFFNPGYKIPGIPFIGGKVALFDDETAKLYDFILDMDLLNGEMCYVFKIIPRLDLSSDEKNRIVINEMTTWFRTSNWEILARNYDLSYQAGVFDFNVHMEIELGKFEDYLVPTLIRYNGSWNVIFKKRETGVFTATLFDFTR
jgi:hypothetical protein